MKTKILLIIVLFASNLITSQEFDVRRVKWGMTKDEVKNSEKPLIATKEENNEFQYEKVELNDRVKSTIIYKFSNGRLIEVRYLIFGPDDAYTRGTCKNQISLERKFRTTKFIFDALVAKQMFVSKYFGWCINNNALENEILKKGKYDTETINLLSSELVRLNQTEIHTVYYNKRSSASVTIQSEMTYKFPDCNDDYYNTYMWLVFEPELEVEEELRKRNF
jgi:hypothetical protein